MKIPIQNLYYLFSYAWDQRLHHGAFHHVDVDGCNDINSLLRRMLAHGLEELARRGIERSYVTTTELTHRVRGAIDLPASERRQTWRQGKMVCSFDELGADIPVNRLLKATIIKLGRESGIPCGERARLSRLLTLFDTVTHIPVHISDFHRVQIHRNNRIYQYLLKLCEFVHHSNLPAPDGNGRHRVRDILSDEATMSVIFEKFVRNFSSRHLVEASVSATQIRWNASGFSEGAEGLVPLMKTDVTISWPKRKLILDCKYYESALSGRFDRHKFLSGNLYQIAAYLANKAVEPGWEEVEGMLLYPANGIHFDHHFTLHGRNRIRMATLDLNKPWKSIHSDLLHLLS